MGKDLSLSEAEALNTELPLEPQVAPNRPDITPAQLVAGIPLLAELAHSFGVFTLSEAQQDSLEKAILWAIALVGFDAVIRFGRNLAQR